MRKRTITLRDSQVELFGSEENRIVETLDRLEQTSKCLKIQQLSLDFERPQSEPVDVTSQQLKAKGTDHMEEIKTTVEPKPKRQYRQKWREYNLAQTREKGHFETLLYELCRGIETPIQLIGRPRLKLGDVIFCLAYKTYTGLAARRLEPDLYELQRRGFVQEAPHFNTPYLYLAMLSLTPYLHALIAQSALPLRAVESDFAVDSTGFGSSQSVRWLDVRYDEERKGWSKVHLICGVKTHIVADAIASGPYEHDYTFFKPLVDHAAQSGFRMKEISADKAYLGGTNFHAALRHGAIPYIPFKSNSTETPRGIESAVWKRLFHFFHFHQEEFYSHYHKRSNVESTFSMIKAKFGASLRSKNETSRFNEALMKVLCHNICRLIHAMYELGVEPTFCEELPPSQKVSR